MTRFYVAFARTVYALLALVLVPLSFISLSSWFTQAPAHTGADFLRMLFWPVLVVLVYGVPSVRGWWRVLRRDDLVPPDRWGDRPVVGGLVVASSVIASLLILWIGFILQDAFSNGYDELGPVGFLMMLAAMATAIALLVGEWVLVGRDD